MKIKKKIWAEYFEFVNSGKKNFELRLNDFDINESDFLVLGELLKINSNYFGSGFPNGTFLANTQFLLK